MTPCPIDAAVAMLGAADFDTVDRAELCELAAASRRARSWLDAIDGRIATATRQLADQGSCEEPADVLAGGGRRRRKDAEAAARRGDACALLPGLGEALAAGEISGGHADAVANLAGKLTPTRRERLQDLEPELVERAKASTVEDFERHITRLGQRLEGDDGASRHERQRARRCLKQWTDRVEELDKFLLSIDAATAAKIRQALRRAIDAERSDGDDRTFDQLSADAFVALLLGKHHSGGCGGVAVLTDLETMRSGLHDASVAETVDGEPLAPETIRRHACDHDIIPIVLNSDGVVVDLGRAVRLATSEQRQALRAMHRSCAYPGCTITFGDCRIHHVDPWQHGGRSDLDRMVPLCQRHHHLVHEGGWSITLHPDRTIEWRRPDGTPHHPPDDIADPEYSALIAALAAAVAARCARRPP